MKLRKLIPTMTVVLLAVILTAGLFAREIPNAQADEVTGLTDWILGESGYVRGNDRGIYPYNCMLFFAERTFDLNTMIGPDVNSYVNGVTALLEVKNVSASPGYSVGDGGVFIQAQAYIPDLDQDVVLEEWVSYDSTHTTVVSATIPCYVEENGELYEGELRSVTARYYLMGREVQVLSWNAES